MKRLRLYGLVGLLFFAVGMAPALGARHRPTDIAPEDAWLYGEASREATQEIVALAALPPVAGLFRPELESPFQHVAGFLKVEPDLLRRAAPHVDRIAAGMSAHGPFGLIRFDGDDWPASLLEGRQSGPDNTAQFGQVTAGARGNVLILGLQPTCLHLLRGDYAPLGGKQTFREAREEAGDAPVWLYADVQQAVAQLLRLGAGSDAEQTEAIVYLAGLATARYATAAWRGTLLNNSLDVRLRLGEQNTGLLGLLSDKPLAMTRRIPQDASAVAALNWTDPESFFGGIRRLVLEAEERAGEAGLREEINAAERHWGVKLDEVFAQLGDGLAVYLPHPGDDALLRPQDITAVLPLADPDGFRDSLNSILSAQGGAKLNEIQHDGLTMLRLNVAPMVVAFLEDRAVFGGNRVAVRDYIQWHQDPDRQLLRADPPRAAAMLHYDMGLLLTSYPRPEPMVQGSYTLSRKGRTVRLEVSAQGLDDPEALMRIYSKAYAGIMGAMLVPSLQRARMQARKAAGMNALRQLAMGVVLYRNDHGGDYPPDLAALVKEGYLEQEALVAAGDDNPQPIGDTGLRSSFVYVGALPQAVPANVIMAYGRPDLRAGGRTCLYVDGHVEWVEKGDLHGPYGRLRQSYERVVQRVGDELDPEARQRIMEFYEVAE